MGSPDQSEQEFIEELQRLDFKKQPLKDKSRPEVMRGTNGLHDIIFTEEIEAESSS